MVYTKVSNETKKGEKKNRKEKALTGRSRWDFWHRWDFRCTSNGTRPAQLALLLLSIALLLFCLYSRQYLQLLRDKVRRTGSSRERSLQNRTERHKRTTHRIRRIRMMVSPLLTSFSSFFSRLRSLMVPRFRCEYTLFARFLIDGAARKVCCIIRTHSSISISLGVAKKHRQPNTMK